MVLKRTFYFLLAISFFNFHSCQLEPNKPAIESVFESIPDSLLISKVKYAKGFDLYELDKIRKLVIYQPELRENIIATFYIADSSTLNNYNDIEEENLIVVNQDNVAVLSATQLNAFERLDLLDKVKGISEAKYIISETIKRKLEKEEIVELATNADLFIEKVITVNPSLIFYSPYRFTNPHPLDAAGIPLIPFYDYFENEPLGRAEWIKFTAVFFDCDDLADSLFNHIEEQYIGYKTLTDNIVNRPTVFSDKYFNGQWYVPGGQSYIAALFKDAGADYLWKDDIHSSSFPLDYEVVYSKAYNADFWRIVGSYGDEPSYEALGAENGLYTNFRAFKDKNVIWCDARKTAYFEKSPLEPHLVLADLIFAFHPESLPAHKPQYYHILK